MRSSKSPKIIGSTALIDLPQGELFGVPAKIDTGADSSAIWVSHIKEVNGTLSFTLLGPESPFYNGKVISAKNYTIRSIKNSFGTTEFRYKVQLQTGIEGKVIQARFTLSDRSLSKYPILIGRRTLQGKFVVDVSKRKVRQPVHNPRRVLVLVNKGGPKFDQFYNHLNQTYQTVFTTEVVRYSDLDYVIQKGQLEITNTKTNQSLQTYDLIYFKTASQNAELAAITAGYARHHLIPYIDMAVERLAPNGKMHQLALLTLAATPVPDTIFTSLERMEQSYDSLVQALGLPFLLKDNHGRKGRHNYLVQTQQDFEAAINVARAEKIQLLAQKFIKNDGFYRVLVLGKKVALVMFRRVDQTRSHLFEPGLDAPAQLLKLQDLNGHVLAMCIRAADCLGWQIAGVDVVQDKSDGTWYCLEVNNSPQLVSGAFIDQKRKALANFFKQQMEK